MTLDFLRSEQESGDKEPKIIAVLSSNSHLFDSAESACRSAGVACERYTRTGKLAKRLASASVSGVVWDMRDFGEDWEGSGLSGNDVRVIAAGPPYPAGENVTCLPADGTPEAIEAYMAMAIETVIMRERIAEEHARLEAAETEAQEHKSANSRLKQHVEFYELQRNQLSEVVRRTAYLGQLSKELNCLDPDKILEICVTKVPKLVDATLASVYLVDEETGELTLKKSNHPNKITERMSTETQAPRLMTMALERKATLLIRDVDNFMRGLNKKMDRTHAGKYATSSCIVAPLVSDNKVMAVLNLADKINKTPFDEVRDLPLIDHICQFIAIALRNCELYQKVWHLAKTDALTGFINHKAFFDELHREIARVRRNKTNLSLILLDVDNFKLFNDVHGHQVGDMILTQVASLIRGNVRTVDAAARYGGDEFAVILSDTETERAEAVAERIRRAIASNQLTLDGQTFFVTISAGVAQYRMGQTLADMVNEADSALYKAKSKGRNAVAVTSTP